jgi:hypothetical protein
VRERGEEVNRDSAGEEGERREGEGKGERERKKKKTR